MRDKIENNVAEIILGIIIIIGICTLSSCGMMNKLSNEQLHQRSKIDYQMNKLYNEYIVKNDSLLIEYYKIK